MKLLDNKNNELQLPNIGDMWNLNYSGICICTQIDHNKQQIQWFMQVKTSYMYQSFHSYRKFVRRQWMKRI